MTKRWSLRRKGAVAFLVALAMMAMVSGAAFAQGRRGGPGATGGSGRAVAMSPTAAAPAGSAATLGTTLSRGFGVPTIRISATGMPLPTTTCDIPYSVHLHGLENEEPPEANPAPVEVDAVMFVAGTTPPTCTLTNGVATWTVNGATVTTAEFGFNFAAEQGFLGTAEILTNSTSVAIAPGTILFQSGTIDLARRVNPNSGEGTGEEGGGGTEGGGGGTGRGHRGSGGA